MVPKYPSTKVLKHSQHLALVTLVPAAEFAATNPDSAPQKLQEEVLLANYPSCSEVNQRLLFAQLAKAGCTYEKPEEGKGAEGTEEQESIGRPHVSPGRI